MNDNDLPEKIQKALKESPTFAPPESFYQGVMEKVRAPKARPFFLRWQVHVAAGVCLVMLLVLADRDGKKVSPVTERGEAKAFREEARPALPSLQNKTVPKTLENEITDQVSVVLAKQRVARNKDWPMQARDTNGPSTQDSFAYRHRASESYAAKAEAPSVAGVVNAQPSGASMGVSELKSSFVSDRKILAQKMKADRADDVLPKAGLEMNWQGLSSGIGEPRQIVVRDAQAWATLWNEHQPGVPMPPVDFTRNMVVGVFLGARPNEGHELHIIDFKTLPDQIALEYQEFLPKEGADYFQRLVQPYALKVVPKTDTYIHFHSLRSKDR